VKVVDDEGVGVVRIAAAPVSITVLQVRVVGRELRMLVSDHLRVVCGPEVGGEDDAGHPTNAAAGPLSRT